MNFSFPPVLLIALTISASASPFKDTLLTDETLLGDGLAEYSFYDAELMLYGAARQTEVRHILVRESFAADAPVKADDWQKPGTVPVIKLNQVIRVPAGVYRYDQMLSTFWRGADGELEKFSLASIDSCGNTYKEGRLDGSSLDYEARTYWEGMDRINRTVALPDDALFYDELPFKLRLLDWQAVREFTAPLVPSVINSKADALTFEPAQFLVEATNDGWQVTVTWSRGTDKFVFETQPPHRLRTWKRADGGSLVYKGGGRLDYWNRNQPGDEKWIDENMTTSAE